MTAEEINQLWAEAKERYIKNEPLYLPREIEAEAEEIQKQHKETSTKEGPIRDFLERKVPHDWNRWDLSQRRAFWSGVTETDESELEERGRVCAVEIWCELFGGTQINFTRRDAMEINSILSSLDDWKRSETSLRCGLYGKQGAYVKVEI